jgi:protein-disulfide isomerase
MDSAAKLAAAVDERDYARGPADAPITVVEYADYECPYSGHAHQILKQLLEDQNGSFKLVFRNFPLTQIRPHSLPAALAAEAAGMQGSFWEMHDLLYEHQDSLEPEHLIIYAQVLGLNVERFIIDMTSDSIAANVREDFVSGIRSGVNGTPTFYIGGERYDGAYDYDSLKKAIAKAAEPKKSSTGAKR